ncbi:MAG: ATP-dependent zinc metalloprotease FtsH [Candidatus Hydrogenedentales bacterium]|jgi:cell division protease FtsH
MNGFLKQASLWIVLIIIVVLALTQLSKSQKPGEKLGRLDFVEQIEKGNVDGVVVKDLGDTFYEVRAKLKQPYKNSDTIVFQWKDFPTDWDDKLTEQGIVPMMERDNNLWLGMLVNVVPFILIVGLFWFFMFRQMQGGSNKALSFGKSRARLMNHSDKAVTFDDVAGVDEAKEDLQEIIAFLKDPKKFSRLGGRIPRGVLLVGPPGAGKTLLARAVAGEAHVPFFSISGSDFVEMFVGVGASRVRDLFQQGQKHAPCIIFIDEIDAVGRQRGAGLGGGHDEREQTLNQLLVEMDGFNTSEGVILMAATNRPDVLDRALLRPGRFDRQVVVSNPDIMGREAILRIHLRNNNVPVDEEVDIRTYARGTPGFSGADLANLVNEAALLAARRDHDKVQMADFEEAKDRVLMGPERRSLVISPAEKWSTAVHEAGHALVGRLIPHGDPIHKVTIIPRGKALGVTSMLPEEDRHSLSKSYCQAQICYMMGGRAAEEIALKELTSGVSNDLKRATELAHAMVCQWGMSDLGPISFGSNSEVFLGRDLVRERDFSEETASAVDKAIHAILDEAYVRARDLLTKHKLLLMAVSVALMKRETLEGDELDEIIRKHGGKDLLPEKVTPPSGPKPARSAAPEQPRDEEEPDSGGLQPGPEAPVPHPA